MPAKRRSQHPYRDSALIYATLGAIVVIVAVLSGSRVLPAVIAGVGAFVLATLWTWWRLRARERTPSRR
jgi:hypothetical protein